MLRRDTRCAVTWRRRPVTCRRPGGGPGPEPPRLRDEHGSAVLLVAVTLVLAALVLAALTEVAALFAVAGRAQATADAAALAAAEASRSGAAAAVRAARRVTAAADAELALCDCGPGPQPVRVEVAVDLPGVVLSPLTGRRVVATASARLVQGRLSPDGPPDRPDVPTATFRP